MSDDLYPIPIREFKGMQSMTIVCERCHAERVIDADEITSEDIYECPADTRIARRGSADPRCRGMACMKYEQADECPGCQALGFYDSNVNAGCCSRKCMFQAEYAKQLAEGRTA